MELKQGTQVRILPEYQDAGDSLFTWVVVEDRGERLLIAPTNTGLAIAPTYNVERTWVEVIGD